MTYPLNDDKVTRMKMNFNGSEYTLTDDLGRLCGWTRDKDKADKIIAEVAQYKLWTDIPKTIRLALAMAGFGATTH